MFRITEEMQNDFIDQLEVLMNSMNADLPNIAGEGSVDAALQILQIELAISILHMQRTYVLVSAVRDYMDAGMVYQNEQSPEFVKAGEDFHGPAAPVS